MFCQDLHYLQSRSINNPQELMALSLKNLPQGATKYVSVGKISTILGSDIQAVCDQFLQQSYIIVGFE